MILRTTCKAVNFFFNVARVNGVISFRSTATLLRWYNLYRHHTNQLARKDYMKA